MNAPNIYNHEIYKLHNFISLINRTHNPFSLSVNYNEVQNTVKKTLAELFRNNVKYLSIDYENSVELIDLKKLNNQVTNEFLRDILNAVSDYDMTPNQSVSLGKFIKINYRDLHGVIKNIKI